MIWTLKERIFTYEILFMFPWQHPSLLVSMRYQIDNSYSNVESFLYIASRKS